jgi:hypothetical protein
VDAAASPNAAVQKSLRWSIARIKPALDSVRQVEYGFTSRNEINDGFNNAFTSTVPQHGAMMLKIGRWK